MLRTFGGALALALALLLGLATVALADGGAVRAAPDRTVYLEVRGAT
jgi:hypothetical protein